MGAKLTKLHYLLTHHIYQKYDILCTGDHFEPAHPCLKSTFVLLDIEGTYAVAKTGM